MSILNNFNISYWNQWNWLLTCHKVLVFEYLSEERYPNIKLQEKYNYNFDQ